MNPGDAGSPEKNLGRPWACLVIRSMGLARQCLEELLQ